MRNIYKYMKLFFGVTQEFIEDDIFHTVVILTQFRLVRWDRMRPPKLPPKSPPKKPFLRFVRKPILKRKEFTKNYLKPLLVSGKPQMTIPDKPNDRDQRYIAVTREK